MVDPEATVVDLAAQGFTHFEMRCGHSDRPGDVRTVHLPFRIFRGPKEVPFRLLLPRLRCEVCGRHVEAANIRPYHFGLTPVPCSPVWGEPETDW